jgi:inner membrane protein
MRVGIAPQVYEGTSVSKLNVGQDFPWLGRDSQQARDVTQFNHFSDGFTALDPANPNRIVDVRYSFVPNEVSALFSIELASEAGPTEHVRYQTHREQAREQFGRLWRLLIEWLP